MNKMNNLEELGKRATEAKYILQALSAERKNEALQAVAKALQVPAGNKSIQI